MTGLGQRPVVWMWKVAGGAAPGGKGGEVGGDGGGAVSDEQRLKPSATPELSQGASECQLIVWPARTRTCSGPWPVMWYSSWPMAR